MSKIANLGVLANGQQIPQNTPLAVTALCDTDPGQVPYGGRFTGDGRISIVLADCAPPGGMTVTVQLKGYQPRTFRTNVPDGQQEVPAVVDGVDVNPLIFEAVTPPFPSVPVFSTDQLRHWKGNMCGIRVSGLPPVPGGANDASLVLSWFYDRYEDPGNRQAIREGWKARGLTHTLLSLPDALALHDLDWFVARIQELQTDVGPVCVFLTSKDYPLPILSEAIPALIDAGVQSFCAGWELNLWQSPTQVQGIIDGVSAMLAVHKAAGNKRALLYVHFSSGVFAWQQDGQTTAAFWNANVGKLTGILFQKELDDDDALWQAHIQDGLTRFAGNDGFTTDSGFGHPFDYVICECSAEPQFNGDMTEAQGNHIGAAGMATPPCSGPTGVTVGVIGFGNGS